MIDSFSFQWRPEEVESHSQTDLATTQAPSSRISHAPPSSPTARKPPATPHLSPRSSSTAPARSCGSPTPPSSSSLFLSLSRWTASNSSMTLSSSKPASSAPLPPNKIWGFLSDLMFPFWTLCYMNFCF